LQQQRLYDWRPDALCQILTDAILIRIALIAFTWGMVFCDATVLDGCRRRAIAASFAEFGFPPTSFLV